MNFIEKIPNWLRYIIAIPFGILCSIGIGMLIIISNWLYSSENWQYISSFLFKNGINIFVFFYGLNLMLPRYKFQITLTISIIFGILYSILQGMSIMNNTMNLEYLLSFIEFIIFLIISCYYSFNKKFDVNNN